MRILLVEDEPKIASFIRRGLKEENYVVDLVDRGENAIFRAETETYDLIILDLLLPDKDGISICKEIRKKKIRCPILMLTAKNSVKDKIAGLDSGADDYLTKPFAFEELLARIRALLRRERQEKLNILKVANIELNQLTRTVTKNNQEIALSNKEYALLEYLLLHKNQAVTRTMISEHVWGESFDSFTNVIDVHINYLRKKIDTDEAQKIIQTIRGRGYILKE